MIDVPIALFPGAKEGDLINITIDPDATKARKEKIKKLMEAVWKDQYRIFDVVLVCILSDVSHDLPSDLSS